MSVLGDTQSPAGQAPGQPALDDPALRRLTRMTPEAHSSLSNAAISFYDISFTLPNLATVSRNTQKKNSGEVNYCKMKTWSFFSIQLLNHELGESTEWRC